MGNAIRPASKTTNTSRRDTASAVSASPHRLKKTHKLEHRPPFDSVALLLQGGGALGAYQAGVYEALTEADLHPDWVAGISIGAINSAIIAGNPREARVAKLREFWELVSQSPFGLDGNLASLLPKGDAARALAQHMSASTASMDAAQADARASRRFRPVSQKLVASSVPGGWNKGLGNRIV